MPEYVLDHHNEGERERLALMSRLLDPLHRDSLEHVGVRSGISALEVGAGNGSISHWLAERVAPDGTVVALDLDLSLIDAGAGNLELREGDIVAAPVEPRDYDVVTARAVLHHVADASAALANLRDSLRPGGALLLIEPDFLPTSIAEPEVVREFWRGWLAWSARAGIDYAIGRTLPTRLAQLGLVDIEAGARTALYNGGSDWAEYWTRTVVELRESLISSGELSDTIVDAFLDHCADPAWWTQTIAFTVVAARASS